MKTNQYIYPLQLSSPVRNWHCDSLQFIVTRLHNLDTLSLDQ